MAKSTTQEELAVLASEVAAPAHRTNYPEPFASRMSGRVKRRLGEVFGLRNFGVNLTRLAPGGISALRHSHSKQDEFIYVLAGTPTLVTDHGEAQLGPGWCAGFRAGGAAHQLVNRTTGEVEFLEIGDRTADDQGTYPVDDLKAMLGADGRWAFTHKDGRPY
jgi:uncharacterized cupin superfamily protein